MWLIGDSKFVHWLIVQQCGDVNNSANIAEYNAHHSNTSSSASVSAEPVLVLTIECI